MSYEEASVVITGASRGIGRHIALSFAEHTDRGLILLARTEKDLLHTKQLCRQVGDNAIYIYACDLSNADALSEFSLPQGFEKPAILVNNAGAYLYKKLEHTRSEEFREQIETNLLTAVHVTNHFLPDIKEMDRGLVINICSVGSLQGLPESGAYSASKHALLGYTRSLRREMLQSNIAVSAINLGQTQSTSWNESDVNAEMLIDPRDVAELLVVLSRLSPRTVAEEIILTPQHGRVPPM